MNGRILSLDFDGVLHPFGGAGQRPFFRKMELLYPLLEQYPEVRVTVHSSWREIHDDEELRDFLFSDRPALENRFIGATPRDVMSRWESIVAWAERNPEAGPYCLLDDEPRMFPHHIARNEDPRFRFIACETTYGLYEGSPALTQLRDWLAQP